jgi:hypothetical protein
LLDAGYRAPLQSLGKGFRRSGALAMVEQDQHE